MDNNNNEEMDDEERLRMERQLNFQRIFQETLRNNININNNDNNVDINNDNNLITKILTFFADLLLFFFILVLMVILIKDIVNFLTNSPTDYINDLRNFINLPSDVLNYYIEENNFKNDHIIQKIIKDYFSYYLYLTGNILGIENNYSFKNFQLIRNYDFKHFEISFENKEYLINDNSLLKIFETLSCYISPMKYSKSLAIIIYTIYCGIFTQCLIIISFFLFGRLVYSAYDRWFNSIKFIATVLRMDEIFGTF